MLNNELPEELYGMWNDRVEEWRNMFESDHVKNIESLASVMASRQEKNKEKREKIAHLAGILVSQRQQDCQGNAHVTPGTNCPDPFNGNAPSEHAVYTRGVESQMESLDEDESVALNRADESNSVAPLEHIVYSQQAEAKGKIDSQSSWGTIPMDQNTTPTTEQMLDRLPVEEIARYLEKKKNKSMDEEQARKPNQSVRTRSMSSKRDSEKKKKTK